MDERRTVRISVDEAGIATLLLSRPEVRNAIDRRMVAEVEGALAQLAADPAVRVLILAGDGGTFAGGADIRQLRERTSVDAMQAINGRMFQQVEDFPHPVIAAVEGWALGGGCELALACDIRIAGEGARFGFPEVSLGIFPAAGGTWRLPRLVGLGRAKELVYTGRILDAREALAIGLVEEVVPTGEATTRARQLAETIARNSAMAVRVAKAAFNAVARGSAPEPIEKLGQAILFDSREKYERMTAFLERKQRKERGA